MIAGNFQFVKDFNCEFGTIPRGSEILVLRGTIYIDSKQHGVYQIEPVYYPLFHSLINSEMKKPNYLKEIPMPHGMN